jgi:hypothetical protein
MILRSIYIITCFIIVILVGCSSLTSLTGGSDSKKAEQKSHPKIPEGVSCYVCHKEEIPEHEFHSKYSRNCGECHVTSTWIAAKYPHNEWPQAPYHRTRCTRCHTKMAEYDFKSYQCWGCHHEQAETKEIHLKLGIKDISKCADCHKGSAPSE